MKSLRQVGSVFNWKVNERLQTIVNFHTLVRELLWNSEVNFRTGYLKGTSESHGIQQNLHCLEERWEGIAMQTFSFSSRLPVARLQPWKQLLFGEWNYILVTFPDISNTLSHLTFKIYAISSISVLILQVKYLEALQGVSDLPKVTQPVSVRARIQVPVACLQCQ